MEELLKFSTLQSYLKLLALFTALLGSILFYKYAHGKAKYFIFYLWILFLFEISYKVIYYEFFPDIRASIIIGNIFDIVSPTFILFWYRNLVTSTQSKKIILALWVFFIVAVVLNSIFLQDILNDTQFYTTSLGVIFIFFSAIMYFREVLEGDFILKLNRSVYFWFSLGILIFCIPVLPLWIMIQEFQFEGEVYGVTMFIANVLMHLSFIIGILWSKKQYNS
ncbi:hypothetical protein ACFQ1M_05810 [Sungkyunkwania multivorans]|uniref:Uncharacterized protein n=1 Tax=Sungkyunkwania multivorans TaxID=1173618 RepID=A0ABW3CVN5_9FLAO